MPPPRVFVGGGAFPSPGFRVQAGRLPGAEVVWTGELGDAVFFAALAMALVALPVLESRERVGAGAP